MRLLSVIAKRFSRKQIICHRAATVLCLITISLLAPFIAPYDPTTIDVHNVLSPPDKAHLLGTDELGRDVLSRMIWGSRVSLKVGFVAVGIAILIGIIIGALSGLLWRKGRCSAHEVC